MHIQMKHWYVVFILLAINFLTISESLAHWSGLEECGYVDGREYTAAKDWFESNNWVADQEKALSDGYSEYPELSCQKNLYASCTVVFRKGRGLIYLDVEQRGSGKLFVAKCY